MPETQKRIRLLIVDDHQLIRQAIRALLRVAPDIEVIGDARDGQEAVTMTQELKPDVVLMDIEMPLMDGVEATRQIVEMNCGARILMLTMREDREDARRSAEVGAHGFQVKNSDRDELIQGIRAVSRGERWVSPSVANYFRPAD